MEPHAVAIYLERNVPTLQRRIVTGTEIQFTRGVRLEIRGGQYCVKLETDTQGVYTYLTPVMWLTQVAAQINEILR